MKDKVVNIFKTKEGETVIAQSPNLPLILAAAFFVLKLFLGDFSDIFETGYLLSLSIWAALEFYSGVNVFRRLLGAVVLINIVLKFI